VRRTEKAGPREKKKMSEPKRFEEKQPSGEKKKNLSGIVHRERPLEESEKEAKN